MSFICNAHNFGQQIPIDNQDIAVSTFDIGSLPFLDTISKVLRVSCNHNNFGFNLRTDELTNHVFISNIKDNSSASRLFSLLRATKNKLRGSYILSIATIPIFSIDDATREFQRLRNDKVDTFTITFAPAPKQTAAQVRTAATELDIFTPEAINDNKFVHLLSIDDVRNIASIRFPDIDFLPDVFPIDYASLSLHVIRSSATTSAEHD